MTSQSWNFQESRAGSGRKHPADVGRDAADETRHEERGYFRTSQAVLRATCHAGLCHLGRTLLPRAAFVTRSDWRARWLTRSARSPAVRNHSTAVAWSRFANTLLLVSWKSCKLCGMSLLQWLRAVPSSRQSFNVVFGECPYCSKVCSTCLLTLPKIFTVEVY